MLPGLAPSVVTRKPGLIRLGGGIIKANQTSFTFPSFNVPFDGRLIIITQGSAGAVRSVSANTVNGSAMTVHRTVYGDIWTPVTIASIAVAAGIKTHAVTYNGAMEKGAAYTSWLLPGSGTTAPSAMANSGAATAAASRSLNINTPAKGVVTAFAWSAWPSTPMRWTGAQSAFDETWTPLGSASGPAFSAADYTATAAEPAHTVTTTYDVSTAGTMVAASWVL